MKIEQVKISDIKPYTKNNKKHSEKQIELVANSIKDFGFNTPVILDEKNIIIAGHCRVEASKKLGLTEIPCIKKSDLTAEQIKAYRIADNKLTEIGDWDFENIDLEISELLDLDFDIERYGLDDFDLNCLNPEVVEDDYIEPEVIKTNIKIGDIIELNNHRLLCGDSTLESSYIDLMQGKKADMVFTDPPYGVSYTGRHFHLGDVNIKRSRESLANDESTDIYTDAISLIAKYCEGACYTWFADTKPLGLFNAVALIGEAHSLIIWHKTNATYAAMNAQYKQRHEVCLYWKPKGKTLGWCGATTESTIWEIKKDGKNNFHPTQKPIELVAKALKNHTAKTVLDPFLGSGSTLIACEQLDRICYGIELEPKYCQVIIDRYKKFMTENKRPFSIKINGKDYK